MDIVLPTGVDSSNFPVGTPPPGVTSNLVDPPSLSWAGRVSVYTTLPLMLVFLLLRFHVRLRSHQVGPDDCRFWYPYSAPVEHLACAC